MSAELLRDALPLLHKLNDEELAGVAKACVISDDPDGTVYIRAGAKPHPDKDTLYMILEGAVLVESSPKKGNEGRIHRKLYRGEIFGLITFVTGGTRTATCTALGPVRIASLTRARFQKLCEDHVGVANALQLAIASQLARDVRACNDSLVKAIRDGLIEDDTGIFVKS